MNWDFDSAEELLALCGEKNVKISEVMLRREMQLGMRRKKSIINDVDRILRVMDVSIEKSVSDPSGSMGGLLGGEAQRVKKLSGRKAVCGPVIHSAIINALAVAETNAGMGVIAAAPTAGASGVLPAVLISAFSQLNMSMGKLRHGLVCAGAIGYLITKNGSVSGAEAGCQAEVGSASAMAAAALVEMLGGTPEQSCDAASVALSNLLGLACDPVGGLVEVPCQSRNTIGAVGAYTAAELAMADAGTHIPLDEMIKITLDVGRSLPSALRETAKGGCATSSVCSACSRKIS